MTERKQGWTTLPYLIVSRANQRMVIGFAHISLRTGAGWPFFGYWIAKSYRRKGYATETARALISTIFRESEVEKVEGYMYSWSLAPQRVVARIGMRRTRNGWLSNLQYGRYFRCVVFQISRQSWEGWRNRRASVPSSASSL
jgi:RimJ/RimL family protein N-acetyltransferase